MDCLIHFYKRHTMALNLVAKGPAMLLRFSQPRIANMVRLAKVELVPSADVGGMLKGVGNLTKDALTFKSLAGSLSGSALARALLWAIKFERRFEGSLL